MKLAVHTSRGSQLPTIKNMYMPKSSAAFIRSVCSDMFHRPEVRTEGSRQTFDCSETLLPNCLLKTKQL